MRFRPEQHLRRQLDFRAVREQGRRIDCGAFTLWVRRRGPTEPAGTVRLGIAASKAALGSSVPRNRAKRRIRELFRSHQELVPAGCDLLIVARSAVNRLDYPQLEQKFIESCRRLAAIP
jgi:ribonuclease P protein component